jgi:hypothetical protein
MKKDCIECGVSFIPKRKDAIFCSRQCNWKHNNAKKHVTKVIKCHRCSKDFKSKGQKHCQKCEAAIEREARIRTATCSVCKTEFTTDIKTKQYCTKKCRDVASKNKETKKDCLICGESFMGTRFRKCCSMVCTQKMRFRDIERKKQVVIKEKPIPQKRVKREGFTSSTEEYFFSLVMEKRVEKKRKCLRCGVLFRTTPELRICSQCATVNARCRSV